MASLVLAIRHPEPVDGSASGKISSGYRVVMAKVPWELILQQAQDDGLFDPGSTEIIGLSPASV
jgi:hypothetical protein